MKKTVNLRTLQHDASLKRIRESVDELVQIAGFEKMTIKMICQHAGIAPATFYHYFQSKNDLMKDRYIRTDNYFNELYEKEWMDMKAVDAMHQFFDYYIEYSTTRVEKLLIEYKKVLMSEFSKWESEFGFAFLEITMKILEKAKENDELENFTYLEALGKMIWSMMCGIGMFDCMIKGEYLKHQENVQVIHEMIDLMFK